MSLVFFLAYTWFVNFILQPSLPCYKFSFYQSYCIDIILYMLTLSSYYMCQPCHHIIRVNLVIIPTGSRSQIALKLESLWCLQIKRTRCVDQTPFKTFVTTQPKLITNGRAVKCQKVEVCLTYSVFRNRASCKSARRSLSGLFGSLYSKP